MPKTIGRIAKFAIYGDEPEALASFYGAVFGWTVSRFKLSDHLPIQIHLEAPRVGRGPLRGGVRLRDTGSPVNGFECVVWVSSVRRVAAAIERHGGRIVYYVPVTKGVGGLLRFQDPAGNVVTAAEPFREKKRRATSNKRMQLTRSALESGRRGPRN